VAGQRRSSSQNSPGIGVAPGHEMYDEHVNTCRKPMAPLQNDKQFQMRVSEDFMTDIDDWRRRQADLPSRSDAVRQLVSGGLWAIQLAEVILDGGVIEVEREGRAHEAILLRRRDGKTVTFTDGEFSTPFPRFVFEGLKRKGIIEKDAAQSTVEKSYYRAAILKNPSAQNAIPTSELNASNDE
jgi:hypothetical protein